MGTPKKPAAKAKSKTAPAKKPPAKAKPLAKGKSKSAAPKFGSPEWRKLHMKPKAMTKAKG